MVWLALYLYLLNMQSLERLPFKSVNDFLSAGYGSRKKFLSMELMPIVEKLACETLFTVPLNSNFPFTTKVLSL